MGDKNKYATQTVSGIVIGIGKTTDIEGYSETILETFISERGWKEMGRNGRHYSEETLYNKFLDHQNKQP